MTNPDHDSIKAGVTDAWDFWLSQHDVSVPATIQAAVKEVVADWLYEHGEAVFREAIKDAVAEAVQDLPNPNAPESE